MQLMIDIAAETPHALRLAAEFLNSHAALREAMEVPTGTPIAPTHVVPFSTPGTTAIVGAAPNIPVNAPTGDAAPFVPPAPTTMSAPNAATPGTSAIPAAPLAPPSPAASVSPVVSAAPLADEYDSAGVPWDARIHQVKKGQKKDGTWKLQKGIDPAVVAPVMQELAPRIRKPQPVGTPPAVGASAPVPLPPPPPPPVSAAPYPGVPQENLSHPTTAGLSAQTSVPPPPVETVAQDADPFRTLVRKVTAARTALKIKPEEVTQCCAQAGVPNLQALNAMPHLVATVEANIDALLATR